eukprot:7082966-Prymnesium_polylepis.1
MKVAWVVLHGRARQKDLAVRFQALDGLIKVGGVLLEHMGLVDDEDRVLVNAKVFVRPLELVVADDDDAAVLEPRPEQAHEMCVGVGDDVAVDRDDGLPVCSVPRHPTGESHSSGSRRSRAPA